MAFDCLMMTQDQMVSENVVSENKVLEILAKVSAIRRTEKESRFIRPEVPSFIVLNLTRSCNLRCSYCFSEADPSNLEKMPFNMVRRIIIDSIELPNDRLDVLFAGGEPLLQFDTIARASEHISNAKPEKPVRLQIQTNATLLTREHVEFFKGYDIHVGVSLDGDENCHNVFRTYANGSGTFRDTVRGIELLKEAGLRVGCLVVLTQANIEHLDRIVDFFLSIGITRFALNPFFPAGRGKHQRNLGVTPDQLYSAMVKFTERLINYNSSVGTANDRIVERNLAFLVKNILTMKHEFMCMTSPCGAGINVLSFDPNGDIYPCENLIDRSDPDMPFRMGNILMNPLEEILKTSNVVNNLRSRTVENLPACRACNWKQYCCGGCTARAYHTYGTLLHVPPDCSYYKHIIPYLLGLLFDQKIDPKLLTYEL
jgi:uncharacterized protein